MLDLTKVSQQIAQMAAADQLEWEDLSKRLETAVNQLETESGRLEHFRNKLERSKTSWLLAGMEDPPNRVYDLPPCPEAYTVVAADGSQIEPSNHEVAAAFLLNIASVVLPYGTGERAELTSQPTLYYRQDDLYMDFGGQRVQVTGELLGMRRTLMEFQCLVDTARSVQRQGHAVCGLSDGSLILWQLQGRPADYLENTLSQFLAAMEMARQARIPIFGYISRPRSRDLINALRVGLCPEIVPNCDRCPYREQPQLPCAEIEGLSDRRLFDPRLEPGERSPVFDSESRILDDYDRHRIQFFYLNVGSEVVRIEIPAWVAADRELLDLAHAVAYSQAQKGGGYPIALAEAHQRAVVRGSEREMFYEMVTTVLVRRGMRAAISPKNMRKRRMTV